jgi:heptosyltransferase-2
MPRFIGDAVMIHQALGPLRRAGIPLVAWGPSALMELFEGSSGFEASVCDDNPNFATMTDLLRKNRAKGVINLPRSSRALVAAFFARTPRRIGWSEGGGWALATSRLSFKKQTGHQIQRYRQLLRKAFPELDWNGLDLFRPRQEAFERARSLRASLNVSSPYIVIGIGAKHWNKKLGTPVLVDLWDQLVSRNFSVLILGGPQEEDVAQGQEIQSLRADAKIACGKSSLSVSAALIAEASAMVGNDSSLSHLAAASGICTLVAFGPTLPQMTAPQGVNTHVFRKESLDCLGCMRFDCHIHTHACMQELEITPMLKVIDGVCGTGEGKA